MANKTFTELLNFSIININKPSGPTSFSVSDFVRNKLGLTKTSHFGTLDPKVTGVLPVALGRACKLTGFFLGHDKTYVGIMHVHKDIELEDLQEIIDEDFVGAITQLPPKKSRVKRAERVREIKRFELLEKGGKEGRDFLFIAEVQGGTYIRKLCHDLGEKVGGAHMLELRRVQAGIFNESTSVNLFEFEKAAEEYKKGNTNVLRGLLTPAEDAIREIMPSVQIKEYALRNLLTGKPLLRTEVIGRIPDEELFAVFFNERFIEIAKKTEEHGLLARADFVFT